MKKRFLLLSIALVSFTAFSFAADAPTTISKNVKYSFNKQFSNARDIKWDNRTDFVKAEFTLNNKVLFAYYNYSGDLIAVTRFISSDKLPQDILTSLRNDYTGFWISDLFEIETESGISYYATIENADQIIILKSEGNIGWQTFQKMNREHAE